MYSGNPVPVFPPRGYSPEPPSMSSGMSRPSARSIYMQRKEYSDSLARKDIFRYRVEHLFTCELDGREVSSIEDCVSKLKNLDSKGKVWGQDMIAQVKGSHLQLCDIQTKEVLESFHLNSIKKTKAVLDSCVYDSLLIITVHGGGQRNPQAFLFQCEEAGAQDVLNDLDRAIQQGGDANPPLIEPQVDIRSHLESILGQGLPGSIKRPAISPMTSTPPPPEFPPPQYHFAEDYVDRRPSPTMIRSEIYSSRYEPELPDPAHSETERNAEIFNHVAEDIEIFVDKVSASLSTNDRNKKKKKSPRNVGNLPAVEEYITCLQKIKYGFNILGTLDGHLKHPPASDFVHSLFTSLGFVTSRYPPNIPPSVLSPLLTEKSLQLLGNEVTPEEDQLWAGLGDAWNIPRSKWPNGDSIPPYHPVFYNGWEPQPPSPPFSRLTSASNSQRFPPRNATPGSPEQDSRSWSGPPSRPSEPLYMRVVYDFMARNSQELSVMKGEEVQVIDKSRQWWKVQNSRNEEGHVPQNVLELVNEKAPAANRRGPPLLDMKSGADEVRAWLQYKGFSKTTVQSLGVFNGAMLLGMKRDDIRAICPDEGGRVFFQLQSVRSAVALANEAGYR